MAWPSSALCIADEKCAALHHENEIFLTLCQIQKDEE